MYVEIRKHSLLKQGEEDVWETIPAICIAIVQNYTLSHTEARGWRMEKRRVKLDDELEPDPASLQHVMLLKKVRTHS